MRCSCKLKCSGSPLPHPRRTPRRRRHHCRRWFPCRLFRLSTFRNPSRTHSCRHPSVQHCSYRLWRLGSRRSRLRRRHRHRRHRCRLWYPYRLFRLSMFRIPWHKHSCCRYLWLQHCSCRLTCWRQPATSSASHTPSSSASLSTVVPVPSVSPEHVSRVHGIDAAAVVIRGCVIVVAG